MQKNKILLIGIGLIGKKHAQILIQYFTNFELYALRASSENAEEKIINLYSWEEVDEHFFLAAFICNPTFKHINTAIECAKRGMHLFIEKPLDNKLSNYKELISIVQEKNLASYVAYCQRFNPVIIYLKEQVEKYKPLHCRMTTTNHLPSWRPEINSKETYSGSKDKGGGVVFDLSHEIDMSFFIFGKTTIKYHKTTKAGEVTLDAVDTADIILETENCPVVIHLNYFGHIAQRQIQVDFEDYSLIAYTKEERVEKWVKREKVDEVLFPQSYEQMYIDQIKYFFSNINTPSAIENNIFEARQVLELLIKLHE